MRIIARALRNLYYQILTFVTTGEFLIPIHGGMGNASQGEFIPIAAFKLTYTGGTPALAYQRGTLGAAATVADTGVGVATITLPTNSPLPQASTFWMVCVRAADGTTAATSGFGQVVHTSDTVKIISLWNAAATPVVTDLDCDILVWKAVGGA